MHYYQRYLHNRLAQEKRNLSKIELEIIRAIDLHEAKGEFVTIIHMPNECYVCNCITNGKKVYVEALNSFEHALGEPNKDDREYDINNEKYPELKMYFADMQNALSAIIKDNKSQDIFIAETCNNISVLQNILQQITGKNVTIINQGKVDLKSRVYFSQKITDEVLNLSIQNCKILDFIGPKGLEVFVPNCEDTLTSAFYNDIKWGDIIPNDCTICKLAATSCYYLKITFEVDCFNNIFCKVADDQSHEKYIMLYAAFGKVEKVEPQLDKETKQEQTDTIHQIAEKNKGDGKKIKLYEGQVVTYYDLFADYLKGAEEIWLEDPFIILEHQISNLQNLILTSNQVNSEYNTPTLKRFHLRTQSADMPENNNRQSESDIQRNLINQKDKLDKMKKNLADIGIEFTYRFEKFHDRLMKLSNGWSIDLGRGLDIFKKAENNMQARTCYEPKKR